MSVTHDPTPRDPGRLLARPGSAMRAIPESCPECGGAIDAIRLPRLTDAGLWDVAYVCTQCPAAAGVCQDTAEPLSTLAGPDLRRRRRHLMLAFKSLYLTGLMDFATAVRQFAHHSACLGNPATLGDLTGRQLVDAEYILRYLYGEHLKRTLGPLLAPEWLAPPTPASAGRDDTLFTLARWPDEDVAIGGAGALDLGPIYEVVVDEPLLHATLPRPLRRPLREFRHLAEGLGSQPPGVRENVWAELAHFLYDYRVGIIRRAYAQAFPLLWGDDAPV